MADLHSILTNGVVFKGDKVLVSRRSFQEQHMPGRWTIPGGKVDHPKGDAFHILEKTVTREILEETGGEIEDEVQMVTNNAYTLHDRHVVAIVFKCQYKSGTAKPLEDTIDCKWVTIDEVKKMDFPPNVKEYILEASKISRPKS